MARGDGQEQAVIYENPNRSARLDSSALEGAHYLPNTNVLFLRFQNGSTYQYDGVAAEVYEQLMDSTSKGRFFLGQIQGRYAYQRAEESDFYTAGIAEELEASFAEQLQVPAGELVVGDLLSEKQVSRLQRVESADDARIHILFSDDSTAELDSRSLVWISRKLR